MGEEGRVALFRIGLNGDFTAGFFRDPLEKLLDASVKRGGPAAKVNGSDRLAFQEGELLLPLEGKSLPQQLVMGKAVGYDVEMAVRALFGAEWNMKVETDHQLSASGSSRIPRFQRFRSENGSSSSSSSRSVASPSSVLPPPVPPSVSSSVIVSMS